MTPRARSAVAATGDRSTHGYVSRPDVHAPASIVSTAATGRAGDSVFLAPFDISAAATNTRSVPASQSRSRPLVVDDRGEPLWFLPLGTKTAMGGHG